MTTKKNCCALALSELSPCQEIFPTRDSNGRHFDFEDSFGPSSVAAVVAKVALGGYTIFTWIYMLVESNYRGFFFSYLTVWVLSLQVIYHIFSLWNSLSPPPGINGRIKFAWWLYNMVVHVDIVVVLLWWLTLYDPDTTEMKFTEIAPHSSTCVVALLDGLLVNRIPIRLHHWYISVLPLNIAYPVWTIVHSLLDIGNPNNKDDDPETNDDVIYDTVDWKDDWQGTLVFIIIMMLVVGPILQLVLYVLSLYSPCCRISRRYLPDEEQVGNDGHNKEDTRNGSDEEMWASAY